MAWQTGLLASLLLYCLALSRGNPLCTNPTRSLSKHGLYNPVYRLSIELGGKCRHGDFYVEDTIGKGNYGEVKRAVHKKTGIIVAIKYLDAINPSKYPTLRNEECNQHAIYSPLIVKHYCTMIYDGKVAFAMEYLDGMTFRTYFKKGGTLTLEQLQYYLAQLVLAVDIFHRHQVIFGSLTSANVMLLTNGKLKIIDMGATIKMLPGERQEAKPEFIQGKARPHRWKNYAHDYYSFGLLMFEFLYANEHKWLDPKELKKLKCQKVLDTTSCDLIHWMYTTEWGSIWGVSKITRGYIRAHPWFADVNWEWLESYAQGEVSINTAVSSKVNYGKYTEADLWAATALSEDYQDENDYSDGFEMQQIEPESDFNNYTNFVFSF